MNRIDPINPIPSLRPRIDCGRLAVLRMIPPLQPPATLHLEAAQAWLDLGNRAEAEAELKQIPRESRNHPSVIKLEIDMSARANDWNQALNLAWHLTYQAPDDPKHWLIRTCCLWEVAKWQEARDLLRSTWWYLQHPPAPGEPISKRIPARQIGEGPADRVAAGGTDLRGLGGMRM